MRAEEVYARVMDYVYDDAIVELHLDGANSAASTGVALPWMIEALRLRGYRFMSVSEMAQPCP